MQTYTVKRIVVGILAAILLLGFCLAGTGALQPDRRPGGGFGGGPDMGGGPGGMLH